MQEKHTTLVRVAIAIVAVHALVSLAHGAAHQALGVTLTAAQLVFVLTVITLAPVAAAIFLWKRATTLGGVFLASSMAASLLFGAYYHFVGVSPDHVDHLPQGTPAWIVAFQVSAIALMFVEGTGSALGIAVLATDRRRASLGRSRG